MRSTGRTPITTRFLHSTGLLLAGSLFLSACSDGGSSSGDTPAASGLQAEIRFTAFGVPHIKADNFRSLGFGVGYVQAEDNLCTLVEQINKLKGERPRYFGAGDNNIHLKEALAYKSFELLQRADTHYNDISEDARQVLEGYVIGFNKNLAEKGAPENYPAPCTGATWVQPITPRELLAYQMDLALAASGRPLAEAIGAAIPPAPLVAARTSHGTQGQQQPSVASGSSFIERLRNTPATEHPALDFMEPALASNGWAIGSERSENATGMLVGNPHFPWEGELRLFEQHLMIPGVINVTGGTFIGLPGVLIGFNEHLGWTHTFSQAKHFTLYTLQINPQNPTQYFFDGAFRDMTQREYSVEVLQDNGEISTVTQTLYFTHYGPMLELGDQSSLLAWSNNSGVTYRDANLGLYNMMDQWMAMDRATNLEEFKATFIDQQANPWVNTMYTDTSGNAYFVDASNVPHLSASAEQYFAGLAQLSALEPLWREGSGIILLDGSNPDHAWVDDSDSRWPGIRPSRTAPQVERKDYVFNANSSHWLSNLAQPLEGFSLVYGPEQTIRSPRTRYNAELLDGSETTTVAGADGRFSRSELQHIALTENGGLTANQLLAPLINRCSATSTVTLPDNSTQDITPACNALSGWDGKYNPDSRGAHLFREFLQSYSSSNHSALNRDLFAIAFDAANPISTPRGLAALPEGVPAEQDPILQALASAQQRLNTAGLSLTATLAEVQFTQRNGEFISIVGGRNSEGLFNINELRLPNRTSSILESIDVGDALFEHILLRQLDDQGAAKNGYPINYGASFMFALEFTPAGPEAAALLTYSQSHNRNSEHYSDQMQQFSQQQWRPVFFTEEEVANNTLETLIITE